MFEAIYCKKPHLFSTYLFLPVLDQLRQAEGRGDRPAAEDGRALQSLPECHGGPCVGGSGRAVRTEP